MSRIISRKHSKSAQLLLLATTLPVTGTQTVHAADEAPQVLPKVTISAQRHRNAYKANTSGSDKYTESLLNTPQSIAVIKKELLEDQGVTSLAEALRNSPGITLQLGENGNTSAGDTFQMRGFSAQSSIFADGIRDLGAVTRDTFNTEQVEVVKGSGGAETGRGINGGFINTLTKLPTLRDSRELGLSVTSGGLARAVGDLNQRLSPDTAIRVNLMAQDGGVEGRDELANQRYAIAPSIAVGLGTPTRFYAYSQHVRQDSVPDGGIPTIGMEGYVRGVATGVTAAQAAALNAAPRVDAANFYGNRQDRERVDADMITLKAEHDVSENLSLQTITRYGKSTMDRVLTSAGQVNAVNPADRSSWTVSLSRQGVDQENTILANQSHLRLKTLLGGKAHELVAGIELMKERQVNHTLAIPTGAVVDTANLYQPNASKALNPLVPNGGYTDGTSRTAAVYLLDTVTLNEQFQVSAGLRADRYTTETDGITVSTSSGSVTKTPFDLKDSGTLLSWRAGAVYKPVPEGSIYLNIAQSKTPPGSANFALSATNGNANNTAMSPQQTSTIELGSKWEVLKRRLALTASLYRTVNDHEVTQDATSGQYFQQGKTRVQGLELGAVGELARNWKLSAGLAFMDTKANDKVSVNATTGAVTTTSGVRWSPDVTATVWTDYNWHQWSVGGGVRYVSDQQREVSTVLTNGLPSTTPALMPRIPAYWVADAMLGYKINKQASVALNVYNLFDQEYIAQLNNSGQRMIMGQPLSAKLSFNYSF